VETPQFGGRSRFYAGRAILKKNQIPLFLIALYCIDPNGGDKPEFGKNRCTHKELVQWRMNHVNASML